MTGSKKIKLKIPSAKAADQPATRRMLTLVRDELKSDIRALDRKMESRFKGQDAKFANIDSRFASIDGRFANIDSRFDQVDSRFAEMESRFDKVDARFAGIDHQLAEMKSEIFRMSFLLEEQNANNRIVLEGLQALWQRQDRMEARLDTR